MRRFALILALFMGSASAEAPPSGPVLVELFSSEGCSSCPPADDVLRALDESGRVSGVPVIALELHVDYWNDLGWPDPFSRAEWSERQRMYAGGRSGGYTPQAVIDGDEEMIGSRSAAINEAIVRASRKPHIAVTMERKGEDIIVRAPTWNGESADVLLAIAERGKITAVPRGENAGRTLRHGPIVRELRPLGTLGTSSFQAQTKVPDPTRRTVAIVQLRKSHKVIGSAAL